MADDAEKVARTMWGQRKSASPEPANKDAQDLAGLRDTRSEVAPTTLEGRERRTNQFEGPRPDGRTLRATGRTEQLNVKVTAEFKKRLQKLADEKKSSMVAIIEYAIECYEDDIRASKGRE